MSRATQSYSIRLLMFLFYWQSQQWTMKPSPHCQHCRCEVVYSVSLPASSIVYRSGSHSSLPVTVHVSSRSWEAIKTSDTAHMVLIPEMQYLGPKFLITNILIYSVPLRNKYWPVKNIIFRLQYESYKVPYIRL